MTDRVSNAAVFVAVSCLVLVGVGLGAALADSLHQPTEVIGPPIVQDMSDLIERLTPATAFVLSADEFGQVLQGSGVVVRSDGWIATSFDLVSWADTFEVKLLVEGELQAFDASLVRTYPALNLALLHIGATDLTTLPRAPLDQIVPGARVIGVGYPSYNRLERGLRITRGQLATPVMADTPPRYPLILAELLYVDGLSGSAVCTPAGEIVGVLIGQDPVVSSLVRVLPTDEVLARVEAVAESYVVPVRRTR